MREVAPEVVGRNAGLDVVRRVDEDPAVEDVRGRVGGVDAGNERLRQEPGRVGLRRLRPRHRRHNHGPGYEDSQLAWPTGYHRARPSLAPWTFDCAWALGPLRPGFLALVLELALGSWLCGAAPGWPPVRVFVGLPQPIRKRRLHLVAVDDAHHVRDLRLRALIGAPHLRVLQPARQEDADLEEALLRPDEEVAGLAGEHDRVVRRVDPLLAEIGRGLAQPLPGLPEILGRSRVSAASVVVQQSCASPSSTHSLQW